MGSRKKKQINIELPELDNAEQPATVHEPPEQPKQHRRKDLLKDDLTGYLGPKLNGSTAEQLAEWQQTRPMLSQDELKHIYLSDAGNMTVKEMADKINSISIERNSNARYANFTLAVAAIGRGANHANVDDLRLRFYTYLELSQLTNMKISNMTALLSIGMTFNKAAWQAANGPEPLRDLLTEIQAVCAGYREMVTADGKLNPVTSIFWQKNYDDMKDRREQEIMVKDPLGEVKTKEEIQKKYADIIIG